MAKIATLISILALLINLGGCAKPVVIAGEVVGDAHDRRTPAVIVNDDKAKLAIGKQIYEHPELKRQVHINVTVYNGIVLLSGEAPDAHRRNLMADIASRTANVRAVHNEVTIGQEATLGSRSKDTLITGRLKTRMAADKELSARHITVITESQTVYLMGTVTRHEADIATQIARQLQSVKQVIRLFEYVD